jgi:hypothetical protein
MFRFRIRDVLWLMLVVGLACAWYVDNHKKVAQIERLRDQLGIHASELPPMPWRIWIKDKLGLMK